MTRAVPVLLLMVLCGCSGERAAAPADEDRADQPETAATAPLQNVASDSRPVIVALGDSITAGYGLPPGQGYPEVLQQLLDEKGYPYRVVNMGVSGDTTGGALQRLPGVLALSPKLVVVEIGGNDGLRGIPVSNTEANLNEIINRLKASGTTVLLAGMTLPQNYGPDYIKAFERIYEELAAKDKVKLMPLRLEKLANGDNPTTLMQNDGLHPTAEGQRRLARYMIGFIEPVLSK